ncbi:Acyl-CoA synthetase (AMP-forming)/AMP-acid ligase II [Hyella patelloides LEGE 07179]|uniref:Acyl-CoA synthetase (AMP-forming)/AMP-acid ligase II n=1 Tax=Hyella patelloides LEGE 07179 TaxID=945734 RepID=A0A563W4M3_9CYAN|nr:2-succinylbenzoate--CoA ligase [Hyella patelloides]VEP18641.1 Acyl-CoA synthetase (AMP-forming)/AMP-acid ligase II [Hyella patelloides LEGE 07179]
MLIQKIARKNILEILKQQTENNWLINYNNFTLLQLTQELALELTNFKSNNQITPTVLLIEPDNLKFIAGFLATIIAEVPVFLGNPHWQSAELLQVQNLLQPDIIWGNKQNIQKIPHKLSRTDLKDRHIIGIPTGGSSGKIRFAIHTTATLSASVMGFAEYFETTAINSCCTLPLYHVSGLMQLWRSLFSQGKLIVVPYSNLKADIKPNITPQDYFLSLVPTQLQFLLNTNPHWLSQFKTILLGGAPSWRSLLNKARQFKIAVATTYGMTETASGITYVKPQDFLQGNYSSGKMLPHAKVEIINKHHKTLGVDTVGTVKIEATSLYYGYYPEYFPTQKPLITDDLGFIDREGFLHIVGRNSQKIITGGENVYPQEVEAAILATKLVRDVCVIGLEDLKWGQIVTALFIPLHQKIEVTTIQQQLQQQLSKYKQPKYWLQVKSLPRDPKGKINYSQLKIIAQELITKQK